MTQNTLNAPDFDARKFAAAVAQAQWTDAEHTLLPFADRDESDWRRAVVAGLARLATGALIQKGMVAVNAEAWLSAEAMFLVLVSRFPNETDPALNLARVRARRGRFASAWSAIETWLPRDEVPIAMLQFALSVAPQANRSAAERAALAERLAGLAPTDAEVWFALATAQLEAGNYGEVHAALGRCLALAPQHLPALWMRMTTPPRRNMRDAVDQLVYLDTWRDALTRIEALPIEDTSRRDDCVRVMGAQPNFYLAYLGQPFHDDVARFGVVLQRIARAAAGRFERPFRPITRSKRRIGIVTRYFQSHSVSKLFVPMFTSLDPDRFECIGIHPSAAQDASTERARAAFTAWHAGDGDPVRWAERISALDCDVLIYPDLGMNAITHALAALRLAPVQVMMWGHPFSSGLPTIDALLTSAAMEPVDGDAHYVEPLVRLPGLGCGFERPQFGASQFRVDRVPGRVVALCGQMWAKLGPQHDAVFAALLARAPTLDLHLTPAVDGEGLDLLRARLLRACREQGVDFDSRVVIHPRLQPADYHALQSQADFLLDSIGWSGGVTAFEAFAQGLPIVSLPGDVMRARHTAAMLRVMELDELIARDSADFVAIAVRLAQDADWRGRLAARVRAHNDRLFDHSMTQQAFAEWLTSVTPRR